MRRVSGEKEFRFYNFRVIVPRSLLTKWAATSTEEVCAIIDSVTAVYAGANRGWKRAKFEPTLEGIRTLFEFENLENAELKKRVLWLLRFERYRALNQLPLAKIFKKAVVVAAREGDQHFFKAVGERLKKKALPFKRPSKWTELAALLTEHWIVKNGLCLCWFSDKAVTGFLKQTHKAYTPDAVRKTRERMGLRKLRPPLVRSVHLDGNRIHLGE